VNIFLFVGKVRSLLMIILLKISQIKVFLCDSRGLIGNSLSNKIISRRKKCMKEKKLRK